MNITIKITSAEQCFSCIRQLLHYYPSLSLTITSDERIPTPASASQAGHGAAHYGCPQCDAIVDNLNSEYLNREAVCRAIECIQRIGSGYRAENPDRAAGVGAHDATTYPWDPAAGLESAETADARAKAAAIPPPDARTVEDGNPAAATTLDGGHYDDTNANGR